MVENGGQGRSRRDSGITILAVIAVGLALFLLRQVLLPLAMAFFLSYIAMPVVRAGNRLKVPVLVSTAVVLVLFASVLGGMGLVLYTSGDAFIEELPVILRKSRPLVRRVMTNMGFDEETIERVAPEAPPPTEVPPPLEPEEPEIVPGEPPPPIGAAEEPLDWTRFFGSSRLMSFAQEWLGNLLGIMGNILVVLLFLVFIILDRGHELMDRRIIAAFSRPGSENARPVVEEIHRDIENYILTKTAISLLTAALTFLVLSIFEIKHADLFALITFFLNYIPNIGSILASVPPILLAWIQFGSFLEALPVAVALTAVQFTVGNILEPVVFGKRLRLNPVTVLIWLVFWGWLWGVWGMILAVPMAATTRIILHRTNTARAVETLMSE